MLSFNIESLVVKPKRHVTEFPGHPGNAYVLHANMCTDVKQSNNQIPVRIPGPFSQTVDITKDFLKADEYHDIFVSHANAGCVERIDCVGGIALKRG